MGYRHEKLKPAILRLTGRKTCRKEIVQTNRRRKKAAFQTCSKSEGRFGCISMNYVIQNHKILFT